MGAPHIDVQLPGIFIHDPARRMTSVGNEIVIAGFVITTTQPTPGQFAKFDRGLAVHAYSNNVFARILGFLIFFLMFSKMASVSSIFFSGLAFTTFRKR